MRTMKTVTAMIWNSDLIDMPRMSENLDKLIGYGIAWVIDDFRNGRRFCFRSQADYDKLMDI
jgi:hypothetical protein